VKDRHIVEKKGASLSIPLQGLRVETKDLRPGAFEGISASAASASFSAISGVMAEPTTVFIFSR
jgi:hypothetical protein